MRPDSEEKNIAQAATVTATATAKVIAATALPFTALTIRSASARDTVTAMSATPRAK